MQHPVYIAIDLKSYYASVECVERGENPLTFNLLVADESRTDKTICLAVSPSLKAIGVPSRPRLFEARQAIRLYEAQHHTTVQYIVAKPQMALYCLIASNSPVCIYFLRDCCGTGIEGFLLVFRRNLPSGGTIIV